METVNRKRVAIGGTFACDEALAVPLQYLLKNAVWNVDVDLQWLPYGSLTDFREWSTVVQNSADLVELLVRLSDLEAAHPELQFTKKDASIDGQEDNTEEGPIQQFVRDLEQYDALATTSTAAPLVVLLCPCPPTTAARFDSMEREMQRKFESMSKVSVRLPGQTMGLFQQQYPTPFYDAIADKRKHSPYTQAMLNVLSLSLCRQICRLYRTPSSRKKVIVLDCDNTLWGGAVAEVGPGGIDLAPRFLALQRFVVAQQQRGMLLALCSKNIFEDVAGAFEQRRDDMVLDLEKHVVSTKINWKHKSENIAQLAKELSLGLDSFVFIDDNPLECNEVATALPSVTVISLPTDFSEAFLDQEWGFDEGLSTRSSDFSGNTREDSQRTQLYQQNLRREQLRESSSTHKAFLSALGVKIVFEELDQKQELRERSSAFTRTLQLHHRTNQFNTATTFAKRMEEAALLEYVAASGHSVICAHVTDRFGHYGLVSAALCQRVSNDNVLRVDSFLLSCRALNRGVEHSMMRRLSEIAAKTEASQLEFVWEPTERNQPAHAFFSGLSDVAFVVSGSHQTKAVDNNKQHLSAANSGTWEIGADKASQVFFLKSEDSSDQPRKEPSGILGWLLRMQPTCWVQDVARSAVRWIISSITLRQRITRLLEPSIVQRLLGVGSAGSLHVSLREPGSLENFLAPVLRDLPDANDFGGTAVDSADSNEDDKFRRKARHQTKLALVNHLHEEAPRVIWSANRPHSDQAAVEDTKEEPTINAPSVTSLHLVCKSPRCSATVQRESQCAFQRCRNCCYRIQRLLTRSLHHANVEARQSAATALETEFVVDAFQVMKGVQEYGLDTQWCKAHQNKRRRGEIYKQKGGQ